MIAVIFEVWPAEGRAQEYFELAAALRADLERIDGFVSIERFQSLTTPGKFLSGQRTRRDLPRLPLASGLGPARLRNARARAGAGRQPGAARLARAVASVRRA
jgi:hypothetical protein